MLGIITKRKQQDMTQIPWITQTLTAWCFFQCGKRGKKALHTTDFGLSGTLRKASSDIISEPQDPMAAVRHIASMQVCLARVSPGSQAGAYQGFGAEGHSLGVVACRGGDDPNLPLLGAEGCHLVVSPSQLE